MSEISTEIRELNVKIELMKNGEKKIHFGFGGFNGHEKEFFVEKPAYENPYYPFHRWLEDEIPKLLAKDPEIRSILFKRLVEIAENEKKEFLKSLNRLKADTLLIVSELQKDPDLEEYLKDKPKDFHITIEDLYLNADPV